jgi:hypothetical protein
MTKLRYFTSTSSWSAKFQDDGDDIITERPDKIFISLKSTRHHSSCAQPLVTRSTPNNLNKNTNLEIGPTHPKRHTAFEASIKEHHPAYPDHPDHPYGIPSPPPPSPRSTVGRPQHQAQPQAASNPNFKPQRNSKPKPQKQHSKPRK